MNDYTFTGPDLFIIGIAFLISFALIWTWLHLSSDEDEDTPKDPMTRLTIDKDCLLGWSNADAAMVIMNSLTAAVELKIGAPVVLLSRTGELFITGHIINRNGYYVTIQR